MAEWLRAHAEQNCTVHPPVHPFALNSVFNHQVFIDVGSISDSLIFSFLILFFQDLNDYCLMFYEYVNILNKGDISIILVSGFCIFQHQKKYLLIRIFYVKLKKNKHIFLC